MRDEKLHAVVARSTFRSQKCQNSSCSDHFSEVKITPMWREAHFEVKIYQTPQGGTTFGSADVEKVHAVVARSTFPSQKCQKLRVLNHFGCVRCRFVHG